VVVVSPRTDRTDRCVIGGFMTSGSLQLAAPRRPEVARAARWTIGVALAAAATAAARPSPLFAQQGGTSGVVVGFVTDGATGQPLSGTTVAITGTPLGSQTD